MDNAATSRSGIEGEVLLWPVRPIQAAGERNAQPHQAEISVLDESNRVVTRVRSDAEGRFRVELAPGTYTLQPVSEGRQPAARRQTVTVAPEGFTHVEIRYDTGIRGPVAQSRT